MFFELRKIDCRVSTVLGLFRDIGDVLLMVCYLRLISFLTPVLVAAGALILFVLFVLLEPKKKWSDEEELLYSYFPPALFVVPLITHGCVSCDIAVTICLTSIPAIPRLFASTRAKSLPVLNSLMLASVAVGSVTITCVTFGKVGLIESVGIWLWAPACCAQALIYLKNTVNRWKAQLASQQRERFEDLDA